MIVLREIASAKINLYLHITGRRADFYHDLDSWVVFAENGDTVEAAKHETLTLTVQGPFAAHVPPEKNSVLAAANALAAHFKVKDGASLTLTKRLPVAAGIGGGTADAAATLRLLTRLWNLHPREGELHALAAKLGSDVPACLRSESLYMSGAGEKIALGPELADWHAVLVNPGKPLATKDVFAAYDQRYSSAMRHPESFASLEAGISFIKQAKNDLQPPALTLLPVIAVVLAALDVQQGCLLSRMSGSGATCFGIYSSRQHALDSAAKLATAYPEWWVQETKLK